MARRPQIAIDYTPALAQRGGIGRYTRGLVDALLADPEALQRWRLCLVVARDAPLAHLPALPAGVRLRRLPLPAIWLTRLWHRARLPVPLDPWLGGADLFHATDYLLPPLLRARGLVTVHDLSYLRHPEAALPALARFLGAAVPRSLARARLVLADSQSTQRDLEQLLGLPPRRVAVVGAGVEPRFGQALGPAEMEAVRTRLDLPGRYILGLGTLEPRKNFLGLIRAFERLAPAHPDLHLFIAGGRGWLYEPILAAAAGSAFADRIRLAGFVDDRDLPALYRMAEAFAFPSFYEGFGIPILEAMASGTPVVTADNSSLPEVAGDAALRVETGDDAALADALVRILDQPALRAELIARGRARAAGFSWEAAASRLSAAYAGLMTED